MRTSKAIVGIGFTLAVLLIAALAITSLYYLSSIQKNMEDIVKVRNVKTDLAFKMLVLGRDRSLSLHRMTMMSDPFELDEELQRFNGYASEFISYRDKLLTLDLDSVERVALDQVLVAVRKSSEFQIMTTEMLQSGNQAEAHRILLEKAIPGQRIVEQQFNQVIELERGLAEAAYVQASANYHAAYIFMWVLGLAAGLIAAGIAIFATLKTHNAEQRLLEANVQLESKVAARTQDLLFTNEKLQSTIDNLSNTQNELIQAGKMASLGSLVAGISHEVNTPLGISVTSASSLQEEVRRIKSEFDQGSMKRSALDGFLIHADEASDILLRNLNRASELIRSFKLVAVDQTSDHVRNFHLRSYIDEIITSLHPNLKRTAIKIENACDENISLESVPGALYQIVSNFVMNSLLHAYDEGQVGLIRIAGKLQSGVIELEYSDDGKGVAEKDIAHVFDPFFTTKRGQGGSGLGLNIVYNLVHSTLKGTIKISSQVGQGTRFTVRFPMVLPHSDSI